MSSTKLAAFVCSRRSIVLCLFKNTELEHSRCLHLHSDPIKAELSVREFVRRSLEQFGYETAAIEEKNDDSRSSLLSRSLSVYLRELAVSLYPVTRQQVLSQLWHFSLKNAQTMRNLARMLWPALVDRKLGPQALDAALIGLYAQCQRLLNIYLQR